MTIRRTPVLLKLGESVYDQVELRKPSGKVLAEVSESLRTANEYLSMRNFLSGCTERLIARKGQDITDPVSIKSAYGKMSNLNLEYFAQEVMVLYYNGEDYIEGLYKCPRCGKVQLAEKKVYDGVEVDTRDRISDLPVNFMESEDELIFSVEFTTAILVGSDYNQMSVHSIKMRFPTTEDYIQVSSSAMGNTKLFFQYAIFAKCLLEVNSEPVEESFRRGYGTLIFQNCLEVERDIQPISKHIRSYGVQPFLKKYCLNPECQKEWLEVIETRNFFGSAPL